MGIAAIKNILETYLIDNWTETQVQFEGVTYGNSTDTWISVKTIPVESEEYEIAGGAVPKVKHTVLFKVFCYAPNPVEAFTLSDTVTAFFDGERISDVYMGIGQRSGALDIQKDIFEVTVDYYSTFWS